MNQLVPIEQKSVNFNGAEIMAVKADNGKVYGAVRWICRGLGLSDGQIDNQQRKINSDPILSLGTAKMQTPTESGFQEVLFLELDYLPLWLAKVNANTISDPDVFRRLLEYQLHAKDVLATAFLSTPGTFGGRRIPQDYVEALEAHLQSEKDKLILEERLAIAAPKAAVYDVAMSAQNSLTMNEAAKVLGWGRNRLFAELRSRRVLMDGNLPYQEHVDAGRFKVKITPVTIGDRVVDKSQTLVTPKGIDYLTKVLKTTNIRSVS